MINHSKLYIFSRKLLLSLTGVLAVAYITTCLFLFVRQRFLIFRPSYQISTLPSAADFKLPYQEVWIPVSNSHERLHAWWVPSPSPQEKFFPIPNEPIKILKFPKVMLYLCGAGGNKSYYNHLARVQAMRQLGFSVLAIDYRGYGRSEGNFPSESQMYADSEAAWNYLVQVRRIPLKHIVIYGESLGGAVALDLAVKHPDAAGVIVQSSFTSMAETVKRMGGFWIFPVDLLLNQKFDSISKVKSLKIPVLFIHGTSDSVVPSSMSQELYNIAPDPKQLFLIPKAEHSRIYQSGSKSYLRVIQNFVEKIEVTSTYPKHIDKANYGNSE